MATNLIKCTRVVSYLPSLRTAVIRCRTLSSTSSTLDFRAQDLTSELTKTEISLPDQLLDPVVPQDQIFSVPGSIGPRTNAGILSQKASLSPDSLPAFDSVFPKFPSQQDTEVTEQFLASLAEIDVDFVDRTMSSPSASDKVEYRAHSCPLLLRKEFKELFPDRNIMAGDLTVITISFKTENDMTFWSADVEQEREKLLEIFVQGASEICRAFEDAGFWADFIDPSSGKPFKGPHTNFTLFETDERYRKLGFEIDDLGCCKVISHPVWKTRSYIGSLFTSAPLDHPLAMNLNMQ